MTTTRAYRQRLRAESAEQTRRRILDAVAAGLRDAPTEPVSLDRVAQSARVARSTIYSVFGSRAGLFDAFVDDLWARTGLPELTEAVANPDARQHLRAGITAASAMYARDRDIYRVLHSMAQLDPASVGGAVQKMEAERAGGMAHVAARLAEDGQLRDGV
ncbi:TetR/AcrR family transcriptional regulator, partial [Nakamurella sp. GG22]